MLERRSFPRKSFVSIRSHPLRARIDETSFLSLTVVIHRFLRIITEEEVNDHRIDSIAASEDPSADDMKVSDWRSHEEEVNNGDDSQKGMLVERNDVGGLALGRQEGPESKCNAAGESWGNCV